MFTDDTFWGGIGHQALNLLAIAMAVLVASPFALFIALMISLLFLG